LCTLSASASIINDWRINGFLSQGLSTTSDNHYFGDSDDRISFDFFEAGLLIEKDLNDTLSLSTKLAYRAPYSIQRNRTSIDHLLLDYHALNGRSWYVGARLGRVKVNYGLYNTTRNTSYTWPTALMNDTVYVNKLLPLYLSTDGINVYGHKDFDSTSVDLELSTGRLKVPGAVVNDLFYGLVESQDLTLKDTLNVKLDLSIPSWRSRFNATFIGFDADITDLNSPPTTYNWRQYSLSWQQAWQAWQLDVELYQATHANTSQGYNLTVHRLFPSGLDIYALLGEYWENSKDKQGETFEALTGLPGSSQFSANYGLGFIYPITPHWDIAAEARYNEGTNSLLFADNPLQDEGLKEHWTQLFIRATYHF